MRGIYFHRSAWGNSGGHPVYRLMMDYPPEGWKFGASEADADLVVVPTRPFYTGNKPWFVFIEDWVTLYNDDIANGSTAGIDVFNHPKTKMLRQQFAAPNFKGIVCHHRGTFADLVALELTDRLFYVPVGMPEQRQTQVGALQPFSFIFINSYAASHNNFVNRGGELVLRAFRELWQAGYHNMRLRVICGIPAETTPTEIAFSFNCARVKIHQFHMPEDEFRACLEDSDCVLLPAHRVHVHSILLPFSYGIPVIASDGWGMDEYVIDGVNGYRAKGVWGETSWRDSIMRENYCRWPTTLRAVPELKARMLQMMGQRGLTQQLGQAAYNYVNDVHPIGRQQRRLKEIFDSV